MQFQTSYCYFIIPLNTMSVSSAPVTCSSYFFPFQRVRVFEYLSRNKVKPPRLFNLPTLPLHAMTGSVADPFRSHFMILFVDLCARLLLMMMILHIAHLCVCVCVCVHLNVYACICMYPTEFKEKSKDKTACDSVIAAVYLRARV